MKRNISSEYRQLYDYVWRMMLAPDKETRIYYGDKALHEIEDHQHNALARQRAVDYLTGKLTEAADKLNEATKYIQTIDRHLQFAEEWRLCLYEAMGKETNKYVRQALRIREKKRKEEGKE